MSAIQKRLQALTMLAFQKVGEIATSSKGKNAELALATIERIYKSVRAALAGTITPDELAKKIEEDSKSLADKLSANNDTIRSEIEKQFPGGS